MYRNDIFQLIVKQINAACDGEVVFHIERRTYLDTGFMKDVFKAKKMIVTSPSKSAVF